MNKKEIQTINQRLDAIDGVFDDFQKLLNNHITDFTSNFRQLKTSVDDAIEAIKAVNDVRDKSIHQKIDTFKWSIALVAVFTACAIGGLIAVAIGLLRLQG